MVQYLVLWVEATDERYCLGDIEVAVFDTFAEAEAHVLELADEPNIGDVNELMHVYLEKESDGEPFPEFRIIEIDT